MISNVDENVGRLFEKLGELELTDNTIVMFMVDNGPNSARYVGPFRGRKSEVHEGGMTKMASCAGSAFLTPNRWMMAACSFCQHLL